MLFLLKQIEICCTYFKNVLFILFSISIFQEIIIKAENVD